MRRSGAEVIGVSSDSVETNQRFRQKLKLPYPLVGDPGGKIAKSYGVRLALLGLAKRASFVIGSDRRIESALLDNFDPEAHVQQACSIVIGTSQVD